MKIPSWLRDGFQRGASAWVRNWPRKKPSRIKLNSAKIIAHRGVCVEEEHIENTLPAFDRAVDAGIWGLELDLRWTRDHVPVVIHDADTRRLFEHPLILRETTFEELRNQVPQIPSLEEVVDRYGKKVHLMIELKEPLERDQVVQNRVLHRILRPLKPAGDFHFMSLVPNYFESLSYEGWLMIPIGEANVPRLSRLALKNDWGGVAGHYLLLTSSRIARHHHRRQQVGTGFIDSANGLFREINRGVDWIFTDLPLHAMQWLDDAGRENRPIKK